MSVDYYKQYEPIFGSWKIVKEIGHGSYGTVFEIAREEFGNTYRAALKAITIPRDEAEWNSFAVANGTSDENVASYYSGVVDSYRSEIELMSRLKGNSYIVSYEDHMIREHADGRGWDILIRMELLTPFYGYRQEKGDKFGEEDVVKLGKDICTALEICEKMGILHRDIKPDNIFVSELGNFKLGDFSVARIVESTAGASTRAGADDYMAPEVRKGLTYDKRADIYSLGITMYRLLNNGRLPLFPDAPSPITFQDKEKATKRRLMGEKLPRPKEASGRVSEIILKACEYEPDNRYDSADSMRKALCGEAVQPALTVLPSREVNTDHETDKMDISHETEEMSMNINVDERAADISDETDKKDPESISNKRGSGKAVIAVAAVIAAAVLGIGGYFWQHKSTPDEIETETPENPADAAADNEASAETPIPDDQEASPTKTPIPDDQEASPTKTPVPDSSDKSQDEPAETPDEKIKNEPTDESVSSETSYLERKVRVNSVSATSYLDTPSQDDQTYDPEHVIDNDYTTAWIEGKDDLGKGESLTLEFPETKNISRMMFYNGFLSTKYRYSINGRVTRLQIDFNDGTEKTVYIKDMTVSEDRVPFENSELDPTEIVFDEPVTASSVKLTILDAVEGTKYKDVAVSEIELYYWIDGNEEESNVTEKGTVDYDELYAPVFKEYIKVLEGDLSENRIVSDQFIKDIEKKKTAINDVKYIYYDLDEDGTCELVMMDNHPDEYKIFEDIYGASNCRIIGVYGQKNDGTLYKTDFITNKDGTDYFLYDNGIICKTKKEEGLISKSFIKLQSNSKKDPSWKLMVTVAQVMDYTSGEKKYYESSENASKTKTFFEKKEIYREISEKQARDYCEKYQISPRIENKNEKWLIWKLDQGD